jgi:hypothetical protein
VNSGQFRVIRKGRWHSHGRTGYVWIIQQDWDYYYEEFYDTPPDLNEEGLAFYALYGNDAEITNHRSRSQTCLSEAEAIKLAEAQFEAVDWDTRTAP